MALRASCGDESNGLAASKCTMQMHLKRTRPTTGVLPHHGELEIAGRKWVCQHDPRDHDGPTAAKEV
jgi:hypothetical protein